MPASRGSSQPRDQTGVSCVASRFFTIWATREATCCSNDKKMIPMNMWIGKRSWETLEFFLKQDCKPANERRSLTCAHSRSQKHQGLLESSEKFQVYSTSTDSHPFRSQRMEERQYRIQWGSREEPPVYGEEVRLCVPLEKGRPRELRSPWKPEQIVSRNSKK